MQSNIPKLPECLQLIIFLCLFKILNFSEILVHFFSRLSEIPKNLEPQDFIKALISNELYS